MLNKLTLCRVSALQPNERNRQSTPTANGHHQTVLVVVVEIRAQRVRRGSHHHHHYPLSLPPQPK